MVDSLQVVLIITLIVMIVFFVVLGVQVYLLIQDMRRTLGKADKVLDNTEEITENISEPISALSGLADTVSAGSLLTRMLKIAVGSSKSSKKSKGERDE